MYHRVVPASESGQDPNSLVLEPRLFSDQLRALYDAGWHTITLGELARDMAAGTTPRARTFVITIDDGWWDGYGYAFPIMQEYGFVGTFFVVANRIDLPGFLTSSQLQRLDEAGNEIGNHTETHASLQSVNLARARDEVDHASDKIAEVTGKRPASLAYPMGGTNSVARQAVGECGGLMIAVTTRWGATETWAGRFSTPRVRVSPSTQPDRLVADLTRWTGSQPLSAPSPSGPPASYTTKPAF